MQACTIYMNETHVVIYCEHNVAKVGYCYFDPMVKLERSKTTVKSLGRTVLDVLNASVEFKSIEDFKGVMDFKAGTQIMVTFAGFKTWGAFANAVDSTCSLEADEKQVTITPAFRDGRGFLYDLQGVVTCKRNVESLGKALFEVLKIEEDNSSA